MSLRRLKTPAGADRLRALVDEALARSPVVLAARSHWQAQTKVPIQAATLPDPEVSLQHFTVGSPQPFSGYESSDFYYTGFGVSQDIPGPGKLRLQKSEAEKDAEYAKHRYEAAGRAVEEKVKELYYELFYHAKTLAILDSNQEELRQIQQIAETRYRLGQGLQQDLIKAQLQTTELLKEHAMHHQEEDQEQLELKQLLGRDPDSRNIDIGDVEMTQLQLDSSELAQLADSGSPDLAADRAMEARSAEALKLAHQGYWPDFTVGYSYEKTGPGFNDYYMLSLGAKVPLYFWRKQTPAIEQAALEAEVGARAGPRNSVAGFLRWRGQPDRDAHRGTDPIRLSRRPDPAGRNVASLGDGCVSSRQSRFPDSALVGARFAEPPTGILPQPRRPRDCCRQTPASNR